MKLYFILLSCCSWGAAIAADLEPPRNPFLANSPWPMTHRNPYNQASSPLPGPVAASQGEAKQILSYLKEEPVSITLNLSEKNSQGRFSIWANTKNYIYKIDGNGKEWVSCEFLTKSYTTKRISGAYTVLDNDGIYYVPSGPYLFGYEEAKRGEPHSAIRQVRSFSLPEKLLEYEDEMIIGINMTYDGYLAVVTNYGLIAIFDRTKGLVSALRVGLGEEVSNSIALDETGGIFIVSNSQIHRVEWSAGSLKPSWSESYPTTVAAIPGRLGKGSGTTPTILLTEQGERLVIIADGELKMNLVAYWADPRETGQFADSIPIQFGNPKIQRAVTEQSVLVRGTGAVVVNNDYGPRKTGKIHNWVTIKNSNKKGIAPYGMEKFEWDSGLNRWKRAWANAKISSPNGIPSMSEATGLIYHLGQNNESWTLEGVDWKTGKLIFRYSMGNQVIYNSYYAATEVGYDDSLLSGTYGGAIRLR